MTAIITNFKVAYEKLRTAENKVQELQALRELAISPIFQQMVHDNIFITVSQLRGVNELQPDANQLRADLIGLKTRLAFWEDLEQFIKAVFKDLEASRTTPMEYET